MTVKEIIDELETARKSAEATVRPDRSAGTLYAQGRESAYAHAIRLLGHYKEPEHRCRSVHELEGDRLDAELDMGKDM